MRRSNERILSARTAFATGRLMGTYPWLDGLGDVSPAGIYVTEINRIGGEPVGCRNQSTH
jgi:hypothetical protein